MNDTCGICLAAHSDQAACAVGDLSERVVALMDEVNELSGIIIILKDDADFFTGDVRELTAWGRVKHAYDKYALGDDEPAEALAVQVEEK